MSCRTYAKQTPYSVSHMVANRDFASLEANSQQCLINAFDSVRFGAHNNRGIFGVHVPVRSFIFFCLDDSKMSSILSSSKSERHRNPQGGLIFSCWTLVIGCPDRVIELFPRQPSQRLLRLAQTFLGTSMLASYLQCSSHCPPLPLLKYSSH